MSKLISSFELLSQEKILEVIKIYIDAFSTKEKKYLQQFFEEFICSSCVSVEAIKLFLQDDHVDPGYNDNYAIRHASLNGHTQIVKLLLQDNRVNPGDDKNHAIRECII